MQFSLSATLKMYSRQQCSVPAKFRIANPPRIDSVLRRIVFNKFNGCSSQVKWNFRLNISLLVHEATVYYIHTVYRRI
jgi:hypothetical protein